MLNRLYKTTKTLVNTDGHGNFSPEKFDLIVYSVVKEKYDDLLFEKTRLSNRNNRGLVGTGLENVSDRTGEKIEHYLEINKPMVYNNGVFEVPADVMYVDLIKYGKTRIELLKSHREFEMVSSKSSIDYPVGLNQGTKISIYPEEIQDNVKVSYLRKPKMNKWTYLNIGGTEIFNPDAEDFQDVDIHESEESDLLIRVLLKFGINLKEKDIQAITQRHLEQDFNEKNIS